MRKLILASSSKYRRSLLTRLALPFEYESPEIDESQKENEVPYELVKRLSIVKAKVISDRYPKAVVIGSDQISVFNDNIIGKSGSFKEAYKQLKAFSGNQLTFTTGVAVICKEMNIQSYAHSKVTVKFKELLDQQIKNYLLQDSPYDCAGSFKIESLGISLFEFVKCNDPTSLEGLPLITLCKLLDKFGIQIPKTG